MDTDTTEDVMEIEQPILDDFITNKFYYNDIYAIMWLKLCVFVGYMFRDKTDMDVAAQLNWIKDTVKAFKTAIKNKKIYQKNQIKDVIVKHIVPFNDRRINSRLERNKNKERIRTFHNCNTRFYMNKYK